MLRRRGVPDSVFSIGHDSNEAHCLIEESEGWHERGHRNAELVFSAESDAAEELTRRVLADGAVRSWIDAHRTD